MISRLSSEALPNLNTRLGIVLTNGERFGGAERRFVRLFVYLRSQGYDVFLFAFDEARQAFESLGVNPQDENVIWCPSTVFRLRKLAKIRFIQTLVSFSWRLRMEHMHFAGNPNEMSTLYSYVTRFGAPYSCSVVNYTIRRYEDFASRSKYFYWRRTIKSSRFVDCLSPQICADMRRIFGVAKEFPRYLTTPCSFTDYSSAKADSDRDIDLCMITRFTEDKGLELLDGALERLSNQGVTGLVIHLRGYGPLAEYVKGFIQRHDSQRITVGHAEDSFSLWRRSKIALSVQYAENYPSQSLLEAMASECAVIATDVGTTRALVDESCGLLIPADATQLSSAIELLLNDEGLRREVGRNASHKVRKEHTIHRFARYFIDSINESS